MGNTDTYVRARIDTRTKALATEALAAMGLSVSDAIRLLMVRIAEEHRLPFAVQVPNASTRKAIEELDGRERRTAQHRGRSDGWPECGRLSGLRRSSATSKNMAI